MVDAALVADLRAKRAAVARAEDRLAAGTFGLSVGSSLAIPDERLETAPLAERTLEEQQRHDEGEGEQTRWSTDLPG